MPQLCQCTKRPVLDPHNTHEITAPCLRTPQPWTYHLSRQNQEFGNVAKAFKHKGLHVPNREKFCLSARREHAEDTPQMDVAVMARTKTLLGPALRFRSPLTLERKACRKGCLQPELKNKNCIGRHTQTNTFPCGYKWYLGPKVVEVVVNSFTPMEA